MSAAPHKIYRALHRGRDARTLEHNVCAAPSELSHSVLRTDCVVCAARERQSASSFVGFDGYHAPHA
jgi:hypothetical protein